MRHPLTVSMFRAGRSIVGFYGVGSIGGLGFRVYELGAGPGG